MRTDDPLKSLSLPRILLVEDSSLMCQMIKHHLASDYEVVDFATGEGGFNYLEKNRVDLLILDYLLPGKNGLDLLKELRSKGRFHHLPVLFMTACEETTLIREAFRCGADDFIRKPFQLIEFDARLSHLIQKSTWTEDLEREVIKLKEKSEIDPLTGHLNRKALIEIGIDQIKRARTKKMNLCLLMIDVDDFKEINDHYGHQAGDEILRQFSALLTSMLRDSDYVFRYGGDEFIILLTNTSIVQAEAVAKKLLSLMNETKFIRDNHEHKVSISIGISAFNEGYSTDRAGLSELIGIADKALYQAKKCGKNIYKVAQDLTEAKIS
jgi:two-component system cell cycle response regulator